MLIGIDGNEANVRERVGVNVWAYEVLRSLATRLLRPAKGGARNDVSVVVYLSKPPGGDLPEEGKNWKYRVIGPAKFWTRWRLPIDLYFHQPRPDVFLSLSHYAPKWSPVPRVVCIMDLSFLEFPEAFKSLVRWQLVNWTRESVKKSGQVITISEFNKREIVKEYGCPAEKITVVYPGVSEIFFYKGQSLRTQGLSFKYGIKGKYILFVGTRQKKKNLERLVEAFKIVKAKFSGVELVIAGKVWHQFGSVKFAKPAPSWEVSQTSHNGIATAPPLAGPRNDGSSGIHYLGYMPERDLPGLVAGAECLVIPSLYEGFGIPAVEGLACGTPVLASNVTSLPEVVGDAGVLFDPYNIDDMADKIIKLLSMSKSERQELVKRGRIRAQMFDWERAAGKVMAVLETIGGKNKLLDC